MQSRLPYFSNVSVALAVLMELMALRQLFFIGHEKRHPKVPCMLRLCDSSLHWLRYQLDPQRCANAGNRVKAWMRCGAQGFVEGLTGQA